MNRRISLSASALIVALMTFVTLSAWASGSSETSAAARSSNAFPQRTVTIIVPYSPGGSYDIYARILAPYLKKYLPHNPNVIVKNVSGGHGSAGADQLYAAKPDGYTIGLLNIPGFVVNQILGTGHFDLKKFTYIGIASAATYVGAVSPKSPYRSIKDLKAANKQILVGSVGLSSAAGLGTLLASKDMGLNAKLIPNNGATQAVMSAIRGDTSYVQESYATLAQYITNKELIPVVVFSKTRLKALPDVPTIAEVGYPKLASIVAQFRPLAAPPNVPADVTQILRKAFEQTMQDPNFQQDMATKLHEPVQAISGPDTATLVSENITEYGKYKSVIEAASK